MDIILDKIWQTLSAEKRERMAVRLYRLICLIIYVLCICLVLPANLFISTMPDVLNYVTIALGLFAVFMYWKSLRGVLLVKTLIIGGTLLLAPCWFLNGGMSGSVTFYYFVVALIPMVLCRSTERSLLLSFITINVVVLSLIQFYWPTTVQPYTDLKSQLADYIPSTLECFIGIALILWVVTTSYDREELAQQIASAQLHKSESDYRGVVENASSIILRINPEHKVSFFNKFGETLFGCQREEIIGKTVEDTIFWNLEKEFKLGLMDRFFSSKIATIEEVELINKHGKAIWISWVSQAIYNKDELVEILCVGSDVTERHSHLKEMEHVQRLESLGVLAGGIAHDYNNLLTAIMGYVSLTKTLSDKSPDIKNYMQAAEDATVHAKALTSQLLTFAKGGQPIKEITALDTLLTNSIGLSLHGKNCKRKITIDPNLAWVEADAAQLTQVFNNLLLNAWQAMPNGGTITVTASNIGDETEISISDTGCGIAEKNLQRIFDPYFTTKKTGTGLGLAVVYSIVKHHQGNIVVTSTEGVGTTFTVRLPARTKPETKDAVAVSAKPVPVKENRILLMDDEPYIRDLAALILSTANFRVTAVSDGLDAIKEYKDAFKSDPYALVIMDLTVPDGMGGLDAIKELLEFDTNINAVVSSGYSNDMGEALAVGFKGVIQKPYTADQLVQSVGEHCS